MQYFFIYTKKIWRLKQIINTLRLANMMYAKFKQKPHRYSINQSIWILAFHFEMAVREELDTFIITLRENIAKSNFKDFRNNVQFFQNKFKDLLTPQDKMELQRIIQMMNKPRATYHEFILFLAVLVIISLVLGKGYFFIKS